MHLVRFMRFKLGWCPISVRARAPSEGFSLTWRSGSDQMRTPAKLVSRLWVIKRPKEDCYPGVAPGVVPLQA